MSSSPNQTTFTLLPTEHFPVNGHTILDPKAPLGVSARLCALAIMTKAPQPGKVKTRLTPPLTSEEAAEINTCFLRDLGRSVARISDENATRGVGVYTPVGAEEAYENILPPEFFLIAQRGEDFGDRLIFAAEDLFSVGFESVCLINSDSPTVPPSSFAAAANELGKPGDRIVLGPSDDGGYYLIGLKKPHRHLFEGIEWSTDCVFDQTMKRAAETGIEVHQLPKGFDIDDSTTLRRLCDALLGEEAGSAIDVAPATRTFLRELIAREGRDRIWPL